MLPKIRLILKKGSNKSSSELNFLQKSSGAQMSTPPPQKKSEAWGLEKLAYSKYCCVGKQQTTSNWEFNAAKNTHHTKKALNKSCSELNFVQKSLQEHMSISPQSGARGARKIDIVKI